MANGATNPPKLARGNLRVVVSPKNRQRGGTGRESAPSFRWTKPLLALVFVEALSPAIAGAQEWHELYAEGKPPLRNGQVERAQST